MADRTELLEAALDSLPEGIALVDAEDRVAFWNRSAEAITGHAAGDLVARPASEALEPLLISQRPGEQEPCLGVPAGSGALVHLRHKLGHDVPAMMRALVLRDGLGGRIGQRPSFIPPRAWMRCRMESAAKARWWRRTRPSSKTGWERSLRISCKAGRASACLWITVDQAHDLRKTHGAGACDAMLEKVERAMANGLRPAEEMGRWGDDEFLVLSHERTPEMLAAHAQVLAGLARTADFRWWGDRVSLTVSVGAAQAEHDGSLVGLLEGPRPQCFPAFMQAETTSRPRRGGKHVCHHRHCRRFRIGHRRLPDGEGPHPGSRSAGRVAHHRRRRHRHAAGG